MVGHRYLNKAFARHRRGPLYVLNGLYHPQPYRPPIHVAGHHKLVRPHGGMYRCLFAVLAVLVSAPSAVTRELQNRVFPDRVPRAFSKIEISRAPFDYDHQTVPVGCDSPRDLNGLRRHLAKM